MRTISSNEKEMSHGTVSWQTRCTYIAMGPLVSSIGSVLSDRIVIINGSDKATS
jgi:hypothetical protein